MSDFISKLDITTFRGIKQLSLSDLSVVNVLVGANNSGKTSVLEAIKYLSISHDVGKSVNLAFLRAPVGKEPHSRDGKIIDYFSTFYHAEIDDDAVEKKQTHYSIEISSIVSKQSLSYSSSGNIEVQYDSRGISQKVFNFSTKTQIGTSKPTYEKYSLSDTGKLESKNHILPTDDFFNSLYMHSGISYYHSCARFLSDAIMNYNKDELLNVIRSFDSSIQDISIVNDSVYLHNNISGTLPLFAYGIGLQKALLLSVILYLYKGNILLIDEIDNAINMAAFRDIFPWFVKKCAEFDVQAFVTTHSVEAIDAILEAESENSKTDDIRIITLRKTPKTHQTIAKIRTGKQARNDRENFGMELRV